MIYTKEDVRVVEADLADARKRLLEVSTDQGATLEQHKRALAWVTGAEDLLKRVKQGLAEQSINEAAKVLGATVERGVARA